MKNVNLLGREDQRWKLVLVFLIMLVFVNSGDLMAQRVTNTVINSNDMKANVDEWYKWFFYLFGLGFILTFLVGSYVVYSKTTGENPQAFMTAAGGWLKGLLFALVVFGVLSGLKLMIFGMGNMSLTS